MTKYAFIQGRGQPRYDHIRDPVSGGINAQVGQSFIKEKHGVDLDLIVGSAGWVSHKASLCNS